MALKETFKISQEQTNAFARASGDFNPLHVDPVAARRYQFGSTVVHGIHGLLKTLDILVKKFESPVAIKYLKVQFNNPVRHDDIVELAYNDHSQKVIRVELYSSGRRTQIIDIEFVMDKGRAPAQVEKPFFESSTALKATELAFSDSESFSGKIDLIWDAARVKELFPSLSDKLPQSQLATLLGTTNIVGMKCPGLHSVYAGLNLSFDINNSEPDNTLEYSVVKRDSRFSLITLAINNTGAHGEIEALFRPLPIQQPDFASIQKLVSHGQFQGQHALVIGGSRGVGEITAKLISAGGGHPVITFARGKADAERVAHEINTYGGTCSAIAYDVLSPELDLDELSVNGSITHIYYFASPLIEKSDARIWAKDLFIKFTDFYILGLASLLEMFVKDSVYRKTGLTVFVPSTIYLDEPQKGFSEYVSAKAAAEAFMKQFSAKYPVFRFACPRLPRMMTDQTSGVANDEPLHAARVMLAAISNIRQSDV